MSSQARKLAIKTTWTALVLTGTSLIGKHSSELLATAPKQSYSSTRPTERASEFPNSALTQQGGLVEIPGESTFVKWSPTYFDALQSAKRDHRSLFIYFTGSNWCSWCQKFDEQVLSDPKFLTLVDSSFSFYRADFPQGDMSNLPQHEDNQNLLHRFGVDGFPTVIVLDSSERVLGRFHFEDIGPEEFAKKLLALPKGGVAPKNS